MSVPTLITLNVNGETHSLAVEPATSLKDVIREDLGLTGTKSGCDVGDCGACTVLMDGKAVNSCLVLAVTANGSEITTIEGLAPPGDLHSLQKSFIKHGALQCGFCTSGMLMSTVELVNQFRIIPKLVVEVLEL